MCSDSLFWDKKFKNKKIKKNFQQKVEKTTLKIVQEYALFPLLLCPNGLFRKMV